MEIYQVISARCLMNLDWNLEQKIKEIYETDIRRHSLTHEIQNSSHKVFKAKDRDKNGCGPGDGRKNYHISQLPKRQS
jgi:hypothetical protein